MSTTKDNVINVSFSPNCCAITVTPRYQWDKGVVLCIKNIQPKESVFLHCSFEGQRIPAYVMTTELKDGNLYGVIPDEMFQQAKQIRCYLYMDNSENGTTIFEVAIPVIPRAKPSDYIYDPMEVIPDVGELLSAWNTVRDVSEKASQVANMTVEAGTLPAGSAATASYQDGKLTLGIPRGLDSETALPTGYKPFDMLVIGPDGKPRWEERTHYDYTGGGTILPLTDLQLIGGYCTFKDPFDNIPVVGFPYHVTYYGYDYDLIAKEWMEDGVRCVTLGNQKDLGGTDWTQEPFIIVFYPEKSAFGTYGYFSCSATSKDTMPVSIESVGELKKIDPKFLPDGVGGGGGLPTGGEPHQQLVTDANGNAGWEDKLAYSETLKAEVLPETELIFIEDSGMFALATQPTNMPIIGVNHTVTVNGVAYECIAEEVNQGDTILVGFGQTGLLNEGTGDLEKPPFVILIGTPEQVGAEGMWGLLMDFTGAVTMAIAIETNGEVVKKVDNKYIENSVFIVDAWWKSGNIYRISAYAERILAEHNKGKTVVMRVYKAELDDAIKTCFFLNMESINLTDGYVEFAGIYSSNVMAEPIGVYRVRVYDEYYNTTDKDAVPLFTRSPKGHVYRIDVSDDGELSTFYVGQEASIW